MNDELKMFYLRIALIWLVIILLLLLAIIAVIFGLMDRIGVGWMTMIVAGLGAVGLLSFPGLVLLNRKRFKECVRLHQSRMVTTESERSET